MPRRFVKANQKELNMERAVHNRATIRVADRADVSGRVTADEVNLDRFHNRIRKVCALVAARPKVYLSAATMILLVTLAVPATAQQPKQVSLTGAIQGLEIETPQVGTTLSVHGSVTGIATHLGQLSFMYDDTVNTVTGKGTGSGQFLIAANGDIIYTTIAGQLVPSSGVGSITETYTITGGTGRFAGAQGSFTVERLLNLVGPGFTAGLFQGIITFAGEEDR
jgi:hypothetical protein